MRRLGRRHLFPVFSNRGFCPICSESATFTAESEWLRDGYRCMTCDGIPRERALMSVLAAHYPNWRDLVVHESSPVQRGVSRLLQTQCRRYVASQYLPNQQSGHVIKGIRCENLEAMSFEDASIDLHITQDVFEHLFNPEKAFAEIARTLKAGGAHIFTVPLVNKGRPSVRRAALDSDGQPLFLSAPEYHANPMSSGGSLVTFDWGV